MYTPAYNLIDNIPEAVEFMRRYSFATIVTVVDNVPTATHLPFIVEQRDNKVVLVSHFAKANHQAKDIFNCRPLVIFTEPHAYVSPKHYEKELNVPTWNYLAVHAYGNATPINKDEEVKEVLEKMIGFYETDYMKQWNNLPPDFKYGLMKGIVAFELIVDDLQGKKKLSQNKTQKEIDNIISAFKASNDQNEQEIAAYMAKLKKD
ncbi:FMN-binding negative transcriptional regulator [Inquilinus sp. KBS0705]|nr:FMN-binding negative transcriptional regulator [Inquilinus sp. KBS0705]